MAGNGWTCLVLLKMAEPGQKWMEMDGNGWKWSEMARMAGHDLKLLKIDRMAGTD